MKLTNGALTYQQWQLARLIVAINLLALCLGLIFGFLQFRGSDKSITQQWQSSESPVVSNIEEDYAVVVESPHWYADAASQAMQTEAAAQKNLEGSPEGFKLIGIQHKQQKMLALFLPLSSTSATAVKTLGEQDILVGDWVVEKVNAGSVILRAQNNSSESKTKEIFLYSQKAK